MKQGRAKVVERIAQNMTSDEFSQLVRQYERLVYTICYQFTKDHQLAEDLAQETFLSAYTHRDDCPPGSYKPWLARIATNKAKDYLKSRPSRRPAISRRYSVGWAMRGAARHASRASR